MNRLTRLSTVLLLITATACVPKGKYNDKVAELATEMSRRQALEARLSGSKQETEDMTAYASQLESNVDEMQRALNELRSRQSAADVRLAQYRELTEKFAELIDAKALRIKIVDGRMVVELANDILFPSGSAALSPEGTASMIKVAAIFATMTDRTFQIEGHTDDQPIKSASFPSNWELAYARAQTVLKALESGGMQPTHLSAASFAFFKPVASNDTEEGRAMNRRIEIVLVPDMSTLPGFDELQKLAEK